MIVAELADVAFDRGDDLGDLTGGGGISREREQRGGAALALAARGFGGAQPRDQLPIAEPTPNITANVISERVWSTATSAAAARRRVECGDRQRSCREARPAATERRDERSPQDDIA